MSEKLDEETDDQQIQITHDPDDDNKSKIIPEIKLQVEERHLALPNNSHNSYETGLYSDTGSQAQNPWRSNGVVQSKSGSVLESQSSTNDTVSIQEDLSTGSIGESHGSSASATARAAHRQYLYPLRSKRYDGLRSSLLPSSATSPHPLPHRLQSRSSSATSMLSLSRLVDDHTQPKSRDNVKWIKLRRINERLYSESGKRAFGTPTALAVSGFVAIGTSKGHILIFDYQQVCKHIIGAGTIGAVTALTISADHTCIAAGHQHGAIFSWDISKPAMYIKHIAPVSSATATTRSGHLAGVRITHLAFVGARHSAFVSADVHGMAFYHNFSRKMIVSQVMTTRLIGRYPTTQGLPTVKPSTTYSASVLPLGTLPHFTDDLGLVAILTPYRLVIVSTAPAPRTQFRYNRPIGAIAESTDINACAAWFPSVKIQASENVDGTNPVLAFSWCRQLRILSIKGNQESSPLDTANYSIEVIVYKQHQVEDAVVAMQWYSCDILCLLTNTSKLQLLDATDLRIIAQYDLLGKHIQHSDIYDQQLRSYFEQRESEYVAQRFTDDFSNSFKVHKEKVFLLGVNDLSIGTVFNWYDKITALVSTGQYIEALQALISYFEGTGELRILGLPRNLDVRREKIRQSLYETIVSSIKHSLASEDLTVRAESYQTRLLSICFEACYILGDSAFIFEQIHNFYEEADQIEPFLSHLGTSILNRSISSVPPSIIQQLIQQYSRLGLYTRLEDIICLVEASALDVNQLSELCKKHSLYNALTYVWNQVVQDFITPMVEYIELIKSVLKETQNPLATSTGSGTEVNILGMNTVNAIKIYSYLSLTLTGKVFPTGDRRSGDQDILGKISLYEFLFSGYSIEWPPGSQKWITTDTDNPEPTFPYLRLLLLFDCPTFLASMDEAFEDPFLNDNGDGRLSTGTAARRPMTRQFIVNILLEVMAEGFSDDDVIYLYMFISRNVPKFSQFILLSGSTLQRILVGLCHYVDAELAEDCQLSVEYLLSIFQPADSSNMIQHFREAGFHRVLKNIYRSGKNWAELLHAYLKDTGSEMEIFACIEGLFMPASALSEKQVHLVEQAVLDNIISIASLDGSRTAILISKYMPDSHKKIFDALFTREGLLYIYLREIFGHLHVEEASWVTPEVRAKYIDLLCIYDRSHLVDYIRMLRLDDIDYERTIDTLETYEFVDAVLYLMSARGKTSEALQRISRQLQISQSQYERADLPSTEVSDSITSSVVKYITIGMRLCETESQSVQRSLTKNEILQVNGSRTMSVDELWVGLLESAFGLYLNLGTKENNLFSTRDNESRKVRLMLRGAKSRIQVAIQDCFTVLFSSTVSRDLDSLVRILALLLSRPIVKSHDVRGMRDVLSDIFNSHQFHFSILALADSILATDLFLGLSHRNEQRRRGWSAQSGTCILCQEQLYNPAFVSLAHKIRQCALEETRRERQLQCLVKVERRHGVYTNTSAAGKKRALPSDASITPHSFPPGLCVYNSEQDRGLQVLPQTPGQPMEPIKSQTQTQISIHAKTQTETRTSFQHNMEEDGTSSAFPHGTTLISYACGHLAHESCTQRYLSTYDNVHGRVHCTVCIDRQDEVQRVNSDRESDISGSDVDHDGNQKQEEDEPL